MTTQHTPTPKPWRLDDRGQGSYWVRDADEEILFGISTSNPYNDSRIDLLSERAAEHIVRACNAHDELVAALRDLVEMNDSGYTIAFEQWDAARAALAKVAS